MVYIFLISLISALEFPINIKSAPASSLDNSVSLSKNSMHKYFDIEFSVPFTLGAPKQNIDLCVTLGHRFTTIPLVGCHCHNSSNRFSPENSLSFQNSSEVFDYGTSFGIRGNWAKDTFLIQNKKIKEIEFVGVTYDDSGYSFIYSDGFLGLGFEYENERHKNFIMQMKEKGYIDKAIFSIYIGHHQSNEKLQVLTIGTWNKEEYGSDEVVTIKVDKSSHLWETKINRFLVGNHLIFSGSAKLYFTTGKSGINIDTQAFNEFSSDLIKAVPSCKLNKSYFVCNCDYENRPKFPNITVEISSNSFVIHPKNYLIDREQGKCLVAVFSNGGNEYWTLGLPYFKEYYNMFDMEKKEIHVSRSFFFEEEVDSHNYIEENIAVEVFSFVVKKIFYFVIIFACFCVGLCARCCSKSH